jgi:nitrogen fixation NifU-like protein
VLPLDDLYQEIILDHMRSPRNKGPLADADVVREGKNPLCGDEVRVSLDVDAGTIADVRYEGRGCAISQSSASMLTEAIKGLTVEEAAAFSAQFKRIMQGSTDFDEDELGELAALLGVRKFPVRVKCATLAWNTLEQGLQALEADSA